MNNKYLEHDVEMYYPETGTWANARTSNLNEELGQIDYVFSDKTGTLTCNQMIFRVCSVGGHIFGKIPDLSKKMATSELLSAPEDVPMDNVRHRATARAIYRKRGKGKEKEKEMERPRPLRSMMGVEGLSEVPVELGGPRGPSSTSGPAPYKLGPDGQIVEEEFAEMKEAPSKKGKRAPAPAAPPAWTPPTKEVDFDDDTIYDTLDDDRHPLNPYLHEFLNVLAVCHTVIPEVQPLPPSLTNNNIFFFTSRNSLTLIFMMKANLNGRIYPRCLGSGFATRHPRLTNRPWLPRPSISASFSITGT